MDIRKMTNRYPYKYWLSKKYSCGDKDIRDVVNAFNIVYNRSEEIGKCKPCSFSRFRNALMVYRDEYNKFLRVQNRTFEQEFEECKALGNDYIFGNTELIEDEFIEQYLRTEEPKQEVATEQSKRRRRKSND